MGEPHHLCNLIISTYSQRLDYHSRFFCDSNDSGLTFRLHISSHSLRGGRSRPVIHRTSDVLSLRYIYQIHFPHPVVRASLSTSSPILRSIIYQGAKRPSLWFREDYCPCSLLLLKGSLWIAEVRLRLQVVQSIPLHDHGMDS